MVNSDNILVEKTFRTNDIIFFAILAGQIIYFLIGLYLIQSGSTEGMESLKTIFMFVTPVVVLSSILAAKFIYSKMIFDFDKTQPLESKLISYRKNNIIKLALFEGANIFNISVMIITADYFFAALFIIIMILFFFNRPTKEKFIMNYEVSADDVLKIIG